MTTGRWAWLGFWGGMLGGVLMAMIAMGNSLIVGHSVFTPLHMIAAPVVGKEPLMHAMKGGPMYIEWGPAVLGMMGHFMWAGLIFGTLFGLIAAWTKLVGVPAIGWGLAYGLAAGFFISLVVNPLVGLPPIWQSQGWVAFVLMHLAYGLGPGLVIWSGTRGHAAAQATPIQRQSGIA